MDARPGRSWIALRLFQGITVAFLLLLGGSVPTGTATSDAEFEAFLRHTTDQRCELHGRRDDLQAVVIDIRFRAEPPLFNQGEGSVVAPVGIDLPGAQRVVDVASQPGYLRKLTPRGVSSGRRPGGARPEQVRGVP